MGKEYVVIGLGRFGGSIVRELNALDMDVMAIDHDENRVNEYSDIATHAVVADTTDEAVMKSLGIRNFDHVIVAIGENIQSSTLTTLILKELGVKVTAKAQNDYHAKILNKIEQIRLCTLSVIWVDVLRIMLRVQVYLIILSWQTSILL